MLASHFVWLKDEFVSYESIRLITAKISRRIKVALVCVIDTRYHNLDAELQFMDAGYKAFDAELQYFMSENVDIAHM